MRARMQGEDPSQGGLHAFGRGCGLGHSDLDGETNREPAVQEEDREAGSPEDPAHPQSCAAMGLSFPSAHPLDPTLLGHNWQLSSLYPRPTYGALRLWLPRSQSIPQLPFTCTLRSWALLHGHPGPPLPAVQPLVGLVAKVFPLSSLPTTSLQAGP